MKTNMRKRFFRWLAYLCNRAAGVKYISVKASDWTNFTRIESSVVTVTIGGGHGTMPIVDGTLGSVIAGYGGGRDKA